MGGDRFVSLCCVPTRFFPAASTVPLWPLAAASSPDVSLANTITPVSEQCKFDVLAGLRSEAGASLSKAPMLDDVLGAAVLAAATEVLLGGEMAGEVVLITEAAAAFCIKAMCLPTPTSSVPTASTRGPLNSLASVDMVALGAPSAAAGTVAVVLLLAGALAITVLAKMLCRLLAVSGSGIRAQTRAATAAASDADNNGVGVTCGDFLSEAAMVAVPVLPPPAGTSCTSCCSWKSDESSVSLPRYHRLLASLLPTRGTTLRGLREGPCCFSSAISISICLKSCGAIDQTVVPDNSNEDFVPLKSLLVDSVCLTEFFQYLGLPSPELK